MACACWRTSVDAREALGAIVGGRSLTREEAETVMRSVMAGEATSAQMGALLAALHVRGETAEEIAGFAWAMRSQAVHVEVGDGAIDVVGTGGDHSNSINISTLSAVVAAGAGARVAKHGNRAASSACGSADVLEALGVRIDLGPEDVGLARAPRSEIVGGDASTNARIARDVFGGSKTGARTAVLLTSGAAAYVAGLAGSVREGVAAAARAIDSGAARDRLDRWVATSQRVASEAGAGVPVQPTVGGRPAGVT